MVPLFEVLLSTHPGLVCYNGNTPSLCLEGFIEQCYSSEYRPLSAPQA